MPLSPLLLWTTAYQWQKLTRFAGDLAASPGETSAVGTNAAEEAARYLRRHHELTPQQWAEVETFACVHRAQLEVAMKDARRGRFCDAESNSGITCDPLTVGQEWRLLFGFAAQFTLQTAGISAVSSAVSPAR